MPFIEDPNADARSLMMNAPCVCSGAKNGIRCKHYWAVMQKFTTANADVVREGKKRRNCTMAPSFMLEWSEDEAPTYCQRYEPLAAPGLVNIARRAVRRLSGTAPAAIGDPGVPALKSAAGYVGFDKAFEDFRPMTVAEIQELRAAHPDKPVDPGIFRFAGLRNPFDIENIMEGEQIGIIPTPAAQAIRDEVARLVKEGMTPEAAYAQAMAPKVSPSIMAALDGDPPPPPTEEKQ